MKPDNVNGVQLIGAPGVWAGLAGFHGENIKIAVIDTGIDYTHANFGGPGTTAAYAAADAADVLPASPSLFGPAAPRVKGGIDLVGDDYNADPSDPAYQPVPFIGVFGWLAVGGDEDHVGLHRERLLQGKVMPGAVVLVLLRLGGLRVVDDRGRLLLIPVAGAILLVLPRISEAVLVSGGFAGEGNDSEAHGGRQAFDRFDKFVLEGLVSRLVLLPVDHRARDIHAEDHAASSRAQAKEIDASELSYFKGSKPEILQGIFYIDGVATKHYSQPETEVIFNEAGLTIKAIERLEYDWNTEFDSPPAWMKEPYPWDWLIECKKIR